MATMSHITISHADLDSEADQAVLVEMLNEYSKGITGSSDGLASDVLARLGTGLRDHPTAFALIARASERPVGFAVCLFGFSTFAAKRTINIHDIGVMEGSRGQGIGRRLLKRVVEIGQESDCCKLTLEVETDNTSALGLYRSMGFRTGDHLDADATALFLERPL